MISPKCLLKVLCCSGGRSWSLSMMTRKCSNARMISARTFEGSGFVKSTPLISQPAAPVKGSISMSLNAGIGLPATTIPPLSSGFLTVTFMLDAPPLLRCSPPSIRLQRSSGKQEAERGGGDADGEDQHRVANGERPIPPGKPVIEPTDQQGP